MTGTFLPDFRIIHAALAQAGVPDATARAVASLTAERVRQVFDEGYDAKHDDAHDDGSIAMAAACYLAPRDIYKGPCLPMRSGQGNIQLGNGDHVSVSVQMASYADAWPWARRFDKRDKHPPERRAAIGGALAIAEIERLQRETERLLRAQGDTGERRSQ